MKLTLARQPEGDHPDTTPIGAETARSAVKVNSSNPLQLMWTSTRKEHARIAGTPSIGNNQRGEGGTRREQAHGKCADRSPSTFRRHRRHPVRHFLLRRHDGDRARSGSCSFLEQTPSTPHPDARDRRVGPPRRTIREAPAVWSVLRGSRRSYFSMRDVGGRDQAQLWLSPWSHPRRGEKPATRR